jgi:2-polyprenyl-3-methyl-5-hydroxy-6-metoxy-1,4-benzoquinol methylase
MKSNQQCYLCKSQQIQQRDGRVRDDDELRVLECEDCGLVFLSSFNHINASFYEDSKMHPKTEIDLDIRDWQNETEWDDERRFQSLKSLIVNKKVLDFGSGSGGFLLKAKEIAQSTTGIELEKRVDKEYKKKGINVFTSIKEIGEEKFDLITLFHVLEHLTDPRESLKELSNKLVSGKGMIYVEVPNADDVLLTLYGNRPFSEFTYWRCHLFLFTANTLSLLAKQSGLSVVFVKQVQRYPLSNHLHWLAKGKPGGHQQWYFLDTPDLHVAYEKQLASIGVCDTIVAGLVPLHNS